MQSLWRYIATHQTQLLRFALVGIFTLGIYSLTFHIFYAYVQLDYRIAITIAYLITVSTHFLLNRRYTFANTNTTVMPSLLKYSMMLAVNYLLILLIMWLLVDILKCTPYLGLILPSLIGAFTSFMIMKYFVFSPRNPTSRSSISLE